MKLVIAGSREFRNYEVMKKALKGLKPDMVISGGARGADKLGERWAKAHKIPFTRYSPDGSATDFATAAKIRNIKMAKASDLVVVFWDGQSPGTRHMINACRYLRKVVMVYDFEGNRTHD